MGKTTVKLIKNVTISALNLNLADNTIPINENNQPIVVSSWPHLAV